MNLFNDAVNLTLDFEGGTNHTVHDRGGLTKWGIAERNYPQVRSNSFTINDAKDIYFKDYWFKSACDEFPAPLAKFMFDTAVNCGQISAAKWLQSSCNIAGGNIEVDGIIGNITVESVKSLLVYIPISGLSGHRLSRYVYMIEKYPEQIKFIRGWVRRVGYLHHAIMR